MKYMWLIVNTKGYIYIYNKTPNLNPETRPESELNIKTKIKNSQRRPLFLSLRRMVIYYIINNRSKIWLLNTWFVVYSYFYRYTVYQRSPLQLWSCRVVWVQTIRGLFLPLGEWFRIFPSEVSGCPMSPVHIPRHSFFLCTCGSRLCAQPVVMYMEMTDDIIYLGLSPVGNLRTIARMG